MKTQLRNVKVLAAMAGAGVVVAMGAVTVVCGGLQTSTAAPNPEDTTAPGQPPYYPSPPATSSTDTSTTSSTTSSSSAPAIGGAGVTATPATPGSPPSLGLTSTSSSAPASTVPNAAPPIPGWIPGGTPPFA